MNIIAHKKYWDWSDNPAMKLGIQKTFRHVGSSCIICKNAAEWSWSLMVQGIVSFNTNTEGTICDRRTPSLIAMSFV